MGAVPLVPDGAKVEKLAGGMKFCEGPVWTENDGGYLVFSDIPQSKLMKWDGKTLTTFRENSHETNGNTRDREERLISCQHAARRVVRIDKNVETTLAERFDGKRFNSPNDCVVKTDGSIWFTDPSYGTPKGDAKEIGGCHVYRIAPGTNEVTKVADGFDMPNGLCFSPDEKTLYIADSGKPHHIRKFNVNGDKLDGGEVFCVIDNGVPDGIRCDEQGNVWSSAGDGAQVFSPDGELITRVLCPESPANLCFGGADGKTLFMTARTSLYAVQTNVRGAVRH